MRVRLKKKLQPKTPAPPPPAATPSVWSKLWPYALLTALALGIYANALGNGFVSDDNFQLLANPLVTDWHQIPQIFQHHIWAFAGQETTNYYRPIQMVLYMALYYVFGFDAFTFHLVMLLLHAANTMLVYRLAKRIIPLEASLVAAVLFAVHPIHNEAVVWIAVLPDMLLTFETLIAVGLFSRWDGSPRGWRIAAICGLFFLALLTKEPGAMLLPLLLGYEFLYLGRSLGAILKNWMLYAAMLAVFAVYCMLRIHALGGMAPAQGFYYKLHGKDLILSVIAMLGQYLGKLVVPIHLNYFYFFEPTTSLGPQVLLSMLGAGGVIAGVFLLRRRIPVASYAFYFILIPLAPALNINGVGENAFTERYLYLPSVGAVIAAAAAWQWLATKQRAAAWSVLGVIVVASFYVLIPRNLDWHDDVRLFTVSAEQSPKSGTLIGNLGWFHYQRQEYPQAIEKYQIALKLQPKTALFHNNLGNALAQMGKPREAIVEIRKAIELKPDYAEAYMNLGLALEAAGDLEDAVAAHQRALIVKPKYAEAYTAIALIRLKAKDYPAAEGLLKRAIEANPRYTEAYINLGVCYNETHRYKDGATAFRKALDIAPAHPSAYITHYNLGVSYSNINSLDAAAYEFAAAAKLRPDFAPAQEAFKKVQEEAKKRPGPPLGIR